MEFSKHTCYLALLANTEKIKRLHESLAPILNGIEKNSDLLSEYYDTLLDLRNTCDSLYEELRHEFPEEAEKLNSNAWEALNQYLFDLEVCCGEITDTIGLVRTTEIPPPVKMED